MHSHPTRGYGFLEGLLADIRAMKANALIPAPYRKGRILDIGCGTYPVFLSSTEFQEKYGIDQVINAEYKSINKPEDHKITLIAHNLEKENTLPFSDNFFDVITMLAVLEHIPQQTADRLLLDIYRTLKPGGIFIATTPASWGHPILRVMAKFWLVSKEEVHEHQTVYTPSKIRNMLERAKFAPKNVDCGYFEMYMNIWARAKKIMNRKFCK